MNMNMNTTNANIKQPPFKPLTQAETTVMLLLLEGYSKEEISKKLKVSINTTTRHLSCIYTKYNIPSSQNNKAFKLVCIQYNHLISSRKLTKS